MLATTMWMRGKAIPVVPVPHRSTQATIGRFVSGGDGT